MPERDELLDHNYDGIQEYDNDLPRWWVAIFLITALYGGFYVVYYHMGPGLLQEEQLAVDMKALEEQRAKHAELTPTAEVSENDLLVLLENQEVVATGKSVFEAKCMACHGMQGQGLVGPNLTDDYWIHGGTLMAIKQIIVTGVPDKGMVPWKGVISDDEIDALTVFIRTLRGTNPPNGKKPEGELFQE